MVSIIFGKKRKQYLGTGDLKNSKNIMVYCYVRISEPIVIEKSRISTPIGTRDEKGCFRHNNMYELCISHLYNLNTCTFKNL